MIKENQKDEIMKLKQLIYNNVSY